MKTFLSYENYLFLLVIKNCNYIWSTKIHLIHLQGKKVKLECFLIGLIMGLGMLGIKLIDPNPTQTN